MRADLRGYLLLAPGVFAILVFAAWLALRRKSFWRGPLETLIAVPWALPGTVFAVALAATFSRHAPWAGRFVLVGTAAILPLGYLVRNLPLTGRAAFAGLRQLDPALECPVALGPLLAQHLRGDEIVVLKASRGVALERILPALKARAKHPAPPGAPLHPR